MVEVKNKIPMDESVEEICEMDVFTVFYFIRVIIDASFRIKDELEAELTKKNDAEISDYES